MPIASHLMLAFDRGISDSPFAMLRSMYVTEFNNDTARIAVREKSAKGWREDNIVKFDRANATDIWIGRLAPSQHNTTSPDVVFNSFSDSAEPKRRRARCRPRFRRSRSSRESGYHASSSMAPIAGGALGPNRSESFVAERSSPSTVSWR